MKYEFVESVVLSPREPRLDVPLMRRLHERWSREARARSDAAAEEPAAPRAPRPAVR
jgi:hypothetical protein